MNHTPGPWHTCLYVGHKPEGDWPGSIRAENGQDIYAGPFSFRALRGATPEEAEANANFIVQACNSHAQLLEALKVLREHCDYADLRQLADAAIEAAGG